MRIGIDIDDTITNSYTMVMQKLGKHYNLNERGYYELTEEGRQEVLEKQEEKINQVEIASAVANKNTREKEIIKEKNDTQWSVALEKIANDFIEGKLSTYSDKDALLEYFETSGDAYKWEIKNHF